MSRPSPMLCREPTGARTTVLLIDDEDELRQEIAEYLNRHGYEVLQCESAGAARRLIAELVLGAKAGVVVLCDEQLSDGDGIDIFIEFAARLPASRWLLMSGSHDGARLAEHQSKNGKLPPYAVIEKPFTLRSLRSALGDPHAR